MLSLRQTEQWGERDRRSSGAPDPGAVWVVAQLEVTPRRHTDYLLCSLSLVATDGRTWDTASDAPTHEGESCAPDPENVQLGTTYPFVLGYEIPAAEADEVAGLALSDEQPAAPTPCCGPGSPERAQYVESGSCSSGRVKVEALFVARQPSSLLKR